MKLEDEVEQDLRERTEEMIQKEVLESDEEGLEMKNKSGGMDREVERKASSKTGASWSSEEIEFLVRQRTSMDNRELEKFLSGEHDAREELRAWKPFSRTEEKFLLQNIQSKDLDKIAERLDRSPEQVKLQLRIMGLESFLE